MKGNFSPEFLSDLRRGIVGCFCNEELRTLCVDLGLDYEALGGEGKEGKARELISHLNRRGQLSELWEYCVQVRPQYQWPRRKIEDLSSSLDSADSGRALKITILFLASDPSDLSRLRLGEELREIQEKLQIAKLRGSFELHQRWSVRTTDVCQALLDVQPQIVHFSGHTTSAGLLCLEDQIAQMHPVSPDALAALFEQFASQVHCVILNSCYSESQAQAIAKHISYVIGMSQAIGDRAAIAFAVGFYQALGAGRTIEEAYKLGCVQIGLQSIPGHLTPVLVQKGTTPL